MKKIIILFLVSVIIIKFSIAQNFEYIGNAPFEIQVSNEPDSSNLGLKYAFKDIDNDEDFDLIIIGFNWAEEVSNPPEAGDIIYFMELQENIGNKFNPVFAPRVEFINDFPFPEGDSFFVPSIDDLNGDNKLDFIISSQVDSNQIQHPLFYIHNENWNFDISECEEWNLNPLNRYSFFIPELVDLDNDNDLDLLMSGFFSSRDTSGNNENIFIYAKNFGTQDQAHFIGWFENPYELIPDTFPIILTSGDLDLDGDMDIFGLGVNNQSIIAYYENSADPNTNPVFGNYEAFPFGLTAPNENENWFFPSLVDIDGDADLDLFIPVDADTIFRLDFYKNSMCDEAIVEITISICDGESYYIEDQEFNENGDYEVVTVLDNGCFEVIYLHLTVIETILTPLNEEICEGESYFLGGQEFFETGIYELDLMSESGCDSIVQLNLTVHPLFELISNTSICEGESYEWEGNLYDQSGTYTIELFNVYGCDSLLVLELDVHTSSTTSLEESICEGEIITIGSDTFSTTGEYQVDLLDEYGCDSIVFLDLIVHPDFITNIDTSMCFGDSLKIGNTSLTQSGAYQVELMSIDNCDSIIMADLEFVELNASISQEGSVLVAYQSPGYYYQWFDCNTGDDIFGAESYLLDVPYSGDFAVRIWNDMACEIISECVSVIASQVESMEEESIMIIPNPSKDKITIWGSQNDLFDRLSIIDISGETLLNKALNTNQEVNLKDLPEGIYFIKLTRKGKTITKRLVRIK